MMADRYTLGIQVNGDTFDPEAVKLTDVANFLIAVEQLFTSIVFRDSPKAEIDDKTAVIGLSSFAIHSQDYTFVTPYPLEVQNANRVIAAAITTKDYARLPATAIDSLKDIRTFNRRYDTVTSFGEQNGKFQALAEITPRTVINPPTNIIKGWTSVYGVLARVGGYNPPRAYIRFIDGRRFSCRVKNTAVASALGSRLYKKIGVRGIASWNISDMSLHDFRIEELLDFEETTLTQAIKSLSEIAAPYYEKIDDVQENIARIRGELEDE